MINRAENVMIFDIKVNDSIKEKYSSNYNST